MESDARAAQTESKRQDKAAKMDLARLKMQHAHELQMAQLHAQSGRSSQAASSSSSHQSHHSSPFPAYNDLSLPGTSFDGNESYGEFDGGFSGGFGSFTP